MGISHRIEYQKAWGEAGSDLKVSPLAQYNVKDHQGLSEYIQFFVTF